MKILFCNKIIMVLASVFFIGFNLESPLIARAETDVFGVISENTTWSIEGSPYIIKSMSQ